MVVRQLSAMQQCESCKPCSVPKCQGREHDPLRCGHIMRTGARTLAF